MLLLIWLTIALFSCLDKSDYSVGSEKFIHTFFLYFFYKLIVIILVQKVHNFFYFVLTISCYLLDSFFYYMNCILFFFFLFFCKRIWCVNFLTDKIELILYSVWAKCFLSYLSPISKVINKLLDKAFIL